MILLIVYREENNNRNLYIVDNIGNIQLNKKQKWTIKFSGIILEEKSVLVKIAFYF